MPATGIFASMARLCRADTFAQLRDEDNGGILTSLWRPGIAVDRRAPVTLQMARVNPLKDAKAKKTA
jgi:hypothetical protein